MYQENINELFKNIPLTITEPKPNGFKKNYKLNWQIFEGNDVSINLMKTSSDEKDLFDKITTAESIWYQYQVDKRKWSLKWMEAPNEFVQAGMGLYKEAQCKEIPLWRVITWFLKMTNRHIMKLAITKWS